MATKKRVYSIIYKIHYFCDLISWLFDNIVRIPCQHFKYVLIRDK